MPYLDLHVHLRGTLAPSLARRLAAANGYRLPGGAITPAGGYDWSDFSSFLDCYDLATRSIQTAADLEDVAWDYLVRSRAEGCIYVEFMLSPPDLARVGVPFDDQLAALASASERGRAIGIESRLIVTAVRHLGAEAAVTAARLAASRAGDLVVGFGLTGDERQFAATDFSEAFGIAGGAGLKRTAHSGEHLPAETILDCVSALQLDRVGHGVRAAESLDVMRRLADLQVPLEVCMSSNLAMRLYDDLDHHPIRTLADAGCAIVLGTDDPGFFGEGIAGEHRMAELRLGATAASKITDTAIDAAFCDDVTKARLRDTVRNHRSGRAN